LIATIARRQRDDLLLVKLALDLLEDVIRCATARQQRQSLAPGQRGALTVAVKGRLAPAAQHIQTLLVLTAGAGFPGVHVKAVPQLLRCEVRIFTSATNPVSSELWCTGPASPLIARRAPGNTRR
jgi:hypothetical protein